MRVLGIDARGLAQVGGAGIAHAARELIDALEKEAATWGIRLVVYRQQESGWSLSRRMKHDGIDHVFVPSGAVSPFITGVIYSWVHDVAIFHHPEWFPQTWLKRFMTTRMFLHGLKNSRHIFCVSKDTQHSLQALLSLADDAISVTYQGVRINQIVWNRCKDRPYVIAIGSVEPRKNLEFIDKLWPKILRSVAGAKFIVAGGQGWGEVLLQHAERITIFDDARRDELLSGASALVLPSWYEGFGRTALEAMTMGVPVVASNQGAIPEVVGQAGVLLSPRDIDGWQYAILKALRGELDGSHGSKRAMDFSWERTARIILAKISETW